MIHLNGFFSYKTSNSFYFYIKYNQKKCILSIFMMKIFLLVMNEYLSRLAVKIFV